MGAVVVSRDPPPKKKGDGSSLGFPCTPPKNEGGYRPNDPVCPFYGKLQGFSRARDVIGPFQSQGSVLLLAPAWGVVAKRNQGGAVFFWGRAPFWLVLGEAKRNMAVGQKNMYQNGTLANGTKD